MIRWTVTGAGPPLLVLPGAACGPASFGALPARLATRRAVHLAHVAGFGDEPPVAAPSWARLLEAVTARLDEVGPAALLGHSLGGTLALAAALARPSDAVVVIEAGPALGPLMYRTEDPAAWRRHAASFVALAADELAFLRAIGRAFAAMLVDPPAHRPLLEEAVRSHPPSVARLLAEAAELDLRPAMPTLRAPVHVALGAHPEAPTRASPFRAQLPDAASFVVLPGARHFPMLEAEDALLAWLEVIFS